MVQHHHLEVSALELLYLLTEVLVRCDEDHKVLWPAVKLQHVHEAVCSLQRCWSVNPVWLPVLVCC